jgi:hypothetical protein
LPFFDYFRAFAAPAFAAPPLAADLLFDAS